MSYVHHCYHLIFSTKNREPLIHKSFQEELYQYIGGILREKQGSLVEIGGVEDHIHILAYYHQSVAPADMVKHIKSSSSRWVNESGKCPHRFRWQIKYGSFSVSQSAIPDVRAYIRNQEEHHKKETFQEEFRRFLKAHGYEGDERFMWE
ncbi:MAG: IS200/IS605 family transposase [Verrucomicrobia bacterium]|nr:IS200/IS605 family transposase [Verrucomicrobiota bacterium]